MRFEIRAPGAIAILLSVVTLSGAVFALGLIAGHEMARQNTPDPNQLSTTYPLPPTSEAATAPAASAAAASAASPAAASSSGSTMSASSLAPKIPAPPPLAAAPAAPVAPAVARANPPGFAPAMKPPQPARPPAAAADEDEDESSATASAEPPAPAVPPVGAAHKPYNIQIEAVMDKSGADEMISRLKTLGYSAQESKTNLNGQVWYRVQVGPYNSEEEARAAQEKLRQQYRQAYTTSH